VIFPLTSWRAPGSARPDYLDFYGHLRGAPLAISRETGTLLYNARRSREGTMYRRVRDFLRYFDPPPRRAAGRQWGGKLITTEFETSKVARAQENLSEGGLIDLVELREGDALQTLKADLPETIDLLLLDGAKSLYPDVLALLEHRLRPGAFVVADDAEVSPSYLARVRSTGQGFRVTRRADRQGLDNISRRQAAGQDRTERRQS
jgi:Methyltransferase domain